MARGYSSELHTYQGHIHRFGVSPRPVYEDGRRRRGGRLKEESAATGYVLRLWNLLKSPQVGKRILWKINKSRIMDHKHHTRWINIMNIGLVINISTAEKRCICMSTLADKMVWRQGSGAADSTSRTVCYGDFCHKCATTDCFVVVDVSVLWGDGCCGLMYWGWTSNCSSLSLLSWFTEVTKLCFINWLFWSPASSDF